MIKIPATEEGLAAITAATAEGISVNVTLIFSLERYRAVMDAYLTGLEQAKAERHRPVDDPLGRVVLRQPRRHRGRQAARRDRHRDEAKALRSKAAVANARLAYRAFEEVFTSDRWTALEGRRRHKQRPLWASTSVKDPNLPDTMYVTELVAPDTVNTMPEATIEATADHGEITGDTGHHATTTTPRRSSTGSRGSASPTTTWSR